MARMRNLPKSAARNYLRRATQYDRQLARSLKSEDWEAVGLTAVHLAIAAADAVTVAKLGHVWSGQDHAGLADLVGEVPTEGVEATARQLRGILELKTRIEYGADVLSPARADDLAKRAKRVYEWAREVLSQDP